MKKFAALAMFTAAGCGGTSEPPLPSLPAIPTVKYSSTEPLPGVPYPSMSYPEEMNRHMSSEKAPPDPPDAPLPLVAPAPPLDLIPPLPRGSVSSPVAPVPPPYVPPAPPAPPAR